MSDSPGSLIQTRVSPQVSKWVAAQAKAAGMPVAAWLRNHLCDLAQIEKPEKRKFTVPREYEIVTRDPQGNLRGLQKGVHTLVMKPRITLRPGIPGIPGTEIETETYCEKPFKLSRIVPDPVCAPNFRIRQCFIGQRTAWDIYARGAPATAFTLDGPEIDYPVAEAEWMTIAVTVENMTDTWRTFGARLVGFETAK